METMEMPSKQVLSFGRRAAPWLWSMGTAAASCCVRCMMGHHKGLAQPLNYSKDGEVTDMDIFALHLLHFMRLFEKQKMNATHLKHELNKSPTVAHLCFDS